VKSVIEGSRGATRREGVRRGEMVGGRCEGNRGEKKEEERWIGSSVAGGEGGGRMKMNG